METTAYDVIVIGGGPGGYVCAIRAAQLGMKVAVVEQRPTLGGTCLNVGCIPSKALLESSELYHLATHRFGVHGIDVSPQLNLGTMMKRKDKVVSALTSGIAGLFRKNGIAPYLGTGRIEGSGQVAVIREGEVAERLEGTHIVIATGSRVRDLPGVERDGTYVVSSTEALSFEQVPEHLVCIGAGIIGLEMGSVWKRLGADVTVLEYLDRPLAMADEDVSKEVDRSLRRLGLDTRTGVEVLGTTVHSDKVTIRYRQDGDEAEMEADKVLVAIGRSPNTEGLCGDGIVLEIDQHGRVVIDDRFSTNLENVWAIGDVVRGPMLAHKAEDEGVALAEQLSGRPGHVNYETIPSVVYTDPEIAWVGATEAQLRAANRDYRVGRFPFMANGRAKAMDATAGFVKILSDKKTDTLLGAHIVGPKAGELIAEIVVAMELGASTEDIARTCHAHPTLSEAIREAALDSDGRVIHL